MSLRAAALLLLTPALLATPAGCRRNPYVDTYVDALTAEYRTLEDQYYDLQFDYEAKLAELEALKRQRESGPSASAGELELPLKRPVRPPDVPDEIGPLSPPVIEQGTPAPPTVPRPDRSEIPPPSQTRPAQAGSGQAPAGSGQAPAGSGQAPAGSGQAPAGSGQALAATASSTGRANRRGRTSPGPRAAADEVAEITVSHLDGPENGPAEVRQGTPLALIIEPRTASGDYVARPGKLTIVALDPRRNGSESRLARWDVSVDDARRALSESAGRRGIHLKLRWPEGTREVDRVQLLVRYEAEAGRWLSAEHQVRWGSAGKVATQWAPRAPQSPAVRVAQVDRGPASERPAGSSATTGSSPSGTGQKATAAGPAGSGLPPVAPSWSPVR